LAISDSGIKASIVYLASAYSFNNSTSDLNTSTPNDLSAGAGSPTATNADSPFAVDANGTPGGTYDYAIVQKATYSGGNTTLTVQVPEGCAIPTSGGVSAVAYSSTANPFGYRDPGNVIGYAEIRANATATTQADINGLTSTVFVPNGRSIRIVFDCDRIADNLASGTGSYNVYIMEGATQIAATQITSIGSGFTRGIHREVEFTPTPGSHTYKMQMSSSSGTITLTASATSPASMSIQLVPQA
jgi:hypothetical protein